MTERKRRIRGEKNRYLLFLSFLVRLRTGEINQRQIFDDSTGRPRWTRQVPVNLGRQFQQAYWNQAVLKTICRDKTKVMAPPTRIERVTPFLGGRCSIH